MKLFNPIAFIQSPLYCKNIMKIHDGIINILAINPRNILFFRDPPAQFADLIFLNAKLVPNTAPIHPNSDDVCIRLNHGPITSSYLYVLFG